MAVPLSFYELSFVDYSREKSRVRVPVTTLTAANLVATVAKIATLSGAIADVSQGNPFANHTQLSQDIAADTPPSNVNAQRERKWLVRYHDASARKFQAEIPCADLTALATNSDFMDTTDALFTALKAAWEDVVISPDDSSATTLDSLEHVGRRG